MEIVFCNKVLPKVTTLGTVSFQVIIDDNYLWCEISCEVLYKRFNALSMEESDLLDAFHWHKSEIERTAHKYLRENDGHPILLMLADF